MNNDIYYVYDNYGGHHKFDGFMLESFIIKQGSWRFGNNFKDKRWSFEVKKYDWRCRKYLKVEDLIELKCVEYVVYDYNYELVPCKKIDQIYIQGAHTSGIWPKYRRQKWRYIPEDYPGFRNGPVPGCGVNNWGYTLRRMKTTQEKRINCAHKEFTRGKRRNLPEHWDDYVRSDLFIKHSWKKQKKRKQWM